MKKLYYSAMLCAAALFSLSACSTGEVPEPEVSISNIVNGQAPVVTGPASIELDRLYTFTASSPVAGDTFIFTVEDTYFNDPRSYGVNVSLSGTRINVVFNDYGRYVITATSKKTGLKCSYEVAKYYKYIGSLKYCSNAPALGTSLSSIRPFAQWFERYVEFDPVTMEFNGRRTNFEQRIVVEVEQKSHAYTYSGPGAPYIGKGDSFGNIFGTAAKGDNVINLEDARIVRHPKYNSWLFENMIYYVPYCADLVYTIPVERCGLI